MAFLGKQYQLERQENFEEFLNSLGAAIPDAAKKKMLAEKPVTKLEKSGDTYTLTSSLNTYVFKSGDEFDEQVLGLPAKTTITVEGNTLTQVQKFPDGVSLTVKREFGDDELLSTTTSSGWDGATRRYYKPL